MDILKKRVLNLLAGQSLIDSWGREKLAGYEPLTTFWTDFTIADAFGEESIEDTFNRAFAEWRSDYKYLTGLTFVLEHKMWQHEDIEVLYELWLEKAQILI